MPDKRRTSKADAATAQEALDALNAAMRARRDSSQVLRRSMEAEIEQKAKNRRRDTLPGRRKR